MERTDKVILGALIIVALLGGSVFVSAVTNQLGSERTSPSIRLLNDQDELEELQESERLAPLAKITSNDARRIALGAVDISVVGSITDIELETEEGIVVYAVEFTKDGIETDVKIDVSTGRVLLIEDDTTDEEDED